MLRTCCAAALLQLAAGLQKTALITQSPKQTTRLHRPIGGIIFGHIGDTQGRNRCLLISIFCMAFSTVAIGILPTYNIGMYKAGIASSILLALLRLLQGMAMGGEFGSAVIYISELASPKRRGVFVAVLQISAHVGMILATVLVMALQNTLSDRECLGPRAVVWGTDGKGQLHCFSRPDCGCCCVGFCSPPYSTPSLPKHQTHNNTEAMLEWGWRVPFLCAFAAAMLGAVLRRGMPEPHAFLAAARAANKARTSSSGGARLAADVDVEVLTSPAVSDKAATEQESDDEDVEAAEEPVAVENSHVRTPIMRLIKGNLAGLLLHICYMGWVSGAFYTTVSWLVKDLRSYGYPLIQTQAMLIVNLLVNMVGLVGAGYLFDRGMRPLLSNAVFVTIGVALGFAVFKSVGTSLPTAWGVLCVFHFVLGGAMANVGLPCTRIYEPLQRTTGFSFGYNAGYGVLGGMSPLAVTAIKAALPHSHLAYAPALWLAVLGVLSLIGSVGLAFVKPRLAKPFVGKME